MGLFFYTGKLGFRKVKELAEQEETVREQGRW